MTKRAENGLQFVDDEIIRGGLGLAVGVRVWSQTKLKKQIAAEHEPLSLRLRG